MGEKMTLEAAPDGTPARWQCRHRSGCWVSITRSQYEALIGNWDYELRTLNVIDSEGRDRD